jgi:hypothetical protein
MAEDMVAGLASTVDASAVARPRLWRAGAAGDRRHGPALQAKSQRDFPLPATASTRAIPGTGRMAGKAAQRVIRNGPFTFGPGAVHDAY